MEKAKEPKMSLSKKLIESLDISEATTYGGSNYNKLMDALVRMKSGKSLLIVEDDRGRMSIQIDPKNIKEDYVILASFEKE